MTDREPVMTDRETVKQRLIAFHTPPQTPLDDSQKYVLSSSIDALLDSAWPVFESVFADGYAAGRDENASSGG